MPKKKSTIVEKTEVEQVNEIIEKEIIKDLGIEEENPVEEKAKEIEVEKPKKDEEVIAEFDPDKFAEQTAIKVKELEKKEQEEKQLEAKREEDKKKLEDEKVPIYVREGRNPRDYEEINSEAIRIAKIEFESALTEREKRALEKSEEESKAKEAELAKSKQFEEDFNKMIDEELNEMYQSNKLPKIVDEKDPNDVGVKAKYDLFKTMADVNTKRAKDGQPPITSISRIFNNYYKPSSQGPAGSDAPVSAGRGVVTQEKEEVMPYHQLHKTSFLDLFRKK